MSLGARRSLAGAATVALLGLGAAVWPAPATSTFSLSRTFDGQNRYDTARKIASGSGFSNVGNVVVATGENFPDALAGNYLAGALGSPIVLTRRDTLPIESVTALQGLDPERVTLLGGTAAIGQQVESDLKGRGYEVGRVQGQDRYGTALAVAGAGNTAGGVGLVAGRRTAFLATGQNFADALAAGPAAFAGKLPVLLTTPSTLSPEARQGLQELGIQQVVILGGTNAVSSNVETQVRAVPGVTTVGRIQGADRTDTAAGVAAWAVQNLDFSDEHVNLARGDDYPDALAGGPHGGREQAVILLAASPTQLDTSVKANERFLGAIAATVETGHIFGGAAAISAAVEAAAERAGGAAPPEAPAGNAVAKVLSVNLAEDYFVSDQNRAYFYDVGDTFQTRGVAATLATFESNLNPDDVVTLTYDPNASGTSVFNISTDVTHPTVAPTVRVFNSSTDPEADADDVQIKVELPKNNSSGTTYVVQKGAYQVPIPGQCIGQIADADLEDAGTLDSKGELILIDVADGCYVFRVVATQPNGVTAPSPRSGNVVVPGPNDNEAPTFADSRVTTDAGEGNIVTNGDVHRFDFSEEMSPTIDDNGSKYRLQDTDGTEVEITCGTNATCAYETVPPIVSGDQNPRNRLTVTLTANPLVTSQGSEAGVSYAKTATVRNPSTHWTDLAGNPVQLGGDVTVDKET